MTKPRCLSIRSLPIWLSAAYSITLCSCSVGPIYHRPETTLPNTFSGGAPKAAAAPLAKNWWMSFADEELNRLIEDATVANQDLQAAMSRVEESAALERIAKSDLSPSISFDPSFHRARTLSSGDSSISSSAPNLSPERAKTANAFSFPLNLQYEFDIWGKLRRQMEYYRYLSEASESDFAFIKQTVLANVAQTYFNIRLSDTQLGIYRQSLELFRRQQSLTQAKYESGLALKTDVLQAETQMNSALAQLTEIQRARSKQEHALAILLGKAPEDFHLPEKPLSTPVPTIPVGIPAALLNQRPDVATAERKLAAANAQIGVAEADFYPTFSITGAAGYESSHNINLLSWSNRVWSIAPAMSLPLFQGGQRIGTLAERRAEYKELVADYRTSVLSALRDVEDELSDLRFLADKAESLDATVRAAKEYSQLTEAQYKQGITTYLQVMDANQTLLTNQLAAVTAQDERLIASVLLVKALGGGWEPQEHDVPAQHRVALNDAVQSPSINLAR